MTDKPFDRLSDLEFDLLLEDTIDAPPPAYLQWEFTPWRRSMHRILWGIVLTTITLNFLNLDTILPGIGILLTLLGCRTLRKENPWFRTVYLISVLRILWFCVTVFLRSTVLLKENGLDDLLVTAAYLWQIPHLISLLALRNGIRAVQVKAGLPPHGGTGLVVWNGLIVIGVLADLHGLLVLILLIAYVFILRSLFRLPRELEEAGYALAPTPAKISDRGLSGAYAAILAVLLAIGYLFFNQYPMDWTLETGSHSHRTETAAAQLAELGFPETVLQDMTEEEILSCGGAELVVTSIRDYDMVQGRGIGTREEIAGGKVALITADQGETHLRFTFIGVKLDSQRWKIIHHFEWLTDTKFCGTEAIQLWPTDHLDGWSMDGSVTGRLLYDKDGTACTADYHFLDDVTYESEDLWGSSIYHDVYATFSLPEDGTRQRGYLLYDVRVVQEGWSVDSWFNYIHQQSQLQFPVQTAMDHRMGGIFTEDGVFRLIQTALQFSAHGEFPELF